MTHDLFRLDGQVALVTGSSRGLGAAMAQALAGAGADIILHDRCLAGDTEQAIRGQSGVRTKCLVADLSDRAAAGRLADEAIAEMGHVDILVNNAGIIRRAPAAEFSDVDWDDVIEINLTAVFRLCRAVGAQMVARGHGKIINIASLLSFQGGVIVPSYAAAKAGVAQLTKSLANEWASKGVNVNAIAPGYMKTDNTKALVEDPVRYRQITERIPAGRWGEPRDLAGPVVFLASRASDYLQGHVLVVDGGWMGR
ncbi:MAG TPA: 2-dehydro-3-deoxy-D-gluconate 5-dehydrogenase KduD [Vicinamibacterales bacterium]|jgi:2-deoxy-D-gluconate 3-dehydrogenase